MSTQRTKNIGILGAGAFGTALALSYCKENKVTIFSCFEDHVESMKNSRKNEFLSGFDIPLDIAIGNISNMKSYSFDYLLWSFPIKPSLAILDSIKSFINSPVIICSKGILENGGFLLDSFKSILEESKVGYMSGPTFANDLALYNFSVADIGAERIEDAEVFAKELSNKYFKLKATSDVIGMQIAGAVKNIIAIACGIVSGLNLGESAHASVFTFGLCEMKNLGLKLGGAESTFYGLSGLGDLVMTASSDTSRNRSFGKRVATGEPVENILKTTTAVCEGFQTLPQIISLAKKYGVMLPICESVYGILFEKKEPNSIIDVFN